MWGNVVDAVVNDKEWMSKAKEQADNIETIPEKKTKHALVQRKKKEKVEEKQMNKEEKDDDKEDDDMEEKEEKPKPKKA